MLRKIGAFASAMFFSGAPLFGADLCLVNDSDRTAIFTVINGSDHFEKQLKPKSREFVSLEDTKNDRVVITQFVSEAKATDGPPVLKVVSTKVLTEKLKDRFNFCYVHGSAEEGMRMDLFAFSCLDVVPLEWTKEPTTEDYVLVRSKLIGSLKSTTEINPESEVNLKKNLWTLGEVKINLR